MAFNKRRYENSLKRKFLKNPGRANRAHRREILNAERGETAAPVRIIPDRRRKKFEKRIRKEMRDRG